MTTDLTILATIAMLAAVTDAIIVRRRLAAVRREYEIERSYCEDAEARAEDLAKKLDTLSGKYATLQDLYATRTRELLANSNVIVTRVVEWKRKAKND